MEKEKELNIINAIDYINDSSLFFNTRFTWIKQLLTKVIKDSLNEGDVDYFVDIVLLKKKTKKKKDTICNEASKSEEESEESVNLINKIKSIDSISNIGLLEVDEPIVLKDGLNLFFGKNGAGKSSIYFSLCKALGKDKKICPNVLSKNTLSSCEITIEDNKKNSVALKWDSSSNNRDTEVKIFDSSISNYIVEQDQENQFKIAHLKTEYFSFLHNLYQEIEEKINREIEIINAEIERSEDLISSNISENFEEEVNLNEKQIKEFKFSKEDLNKMRRVEKEISILEKNNAELFLNSIRNLIEEIEDILDVFGFKNENDEWEFNYDENHFNEINDQIDNFRKAKKSFENSGRSKISSIIPPDWIDKNLWERFISSSIDFLNSLEQKELNKYSKKTCLYCHQEIKTREASILMDSYRDLHKNYRDILNVEELRIKEVLSSLDDCIESIQKLSLKNNKWEKEFKAFGKSNKIDIDTEKIKNIFEKYKKEISNKNKINLKKEDEKCLNDFWNIYTEILNELAKLLVKFEKDIGNRDSELGNLKEKYETLKNKKAIFDNKDKLLNYKRLKKLKEILEDKLSDIPSLRQITSSLKSSFTREASLKEFKEYLISEYKKFDFLPPKVWNIAPSTRENVSRRVYNIGDKRLVDVFSEGEQKIHALADFFATNQLDKYKGIFIFDDPVNSLDQDNIVAVANRIIDLVSEGNQVIIFTHNIYFLNSIIKNQKVRVTRIEKGDNQINLIREVVVGDVQELKSRFEFIESKIKELSSNDAGTVNEYEIKGIYDLISGFLEDFVEKVYFKNIISRFRPNIMMNSLSRLEYMDTSRISQISDFYEKTSRMCSRHSQPEDVEKPTLSGLVADFDKLKKDYKWS